MGVLVIVIKIFEPIISYINSQSENDSLFPKTAENGYPYAEQINYNLQDIKQISHYLLEKNKENVQNIPLKISTFNLCSFGKQINICKDNQQCFQSLKNNINENNNNYIYHNTKSFSTDEYLNNEKIIELFQEENQFNSKNFINKIELPFYYKLINGYDSYINIISKDTNLIKEITHNEVKLNNLLDFYSLFLFAYIKQGNITKDLAINKLMSYKEEELINQINQIKMGERKELDKIFNINLIENIINCLPDSDMRYSFSIDINSILSMQSILLDNNKIENNFFNFVFFKLNQGINYIFTEDEKLRINAEFYQKYKIYFISIYWIISLAFVYFCNKYFLSHKEFYGQKSRLGKSMNNSQELKKYKRYQQNLQKIIQKQNRSKYSPEELKMIENLTKKKDDYIITKN